MVLAQGSRVWRSFSRVSGWRVDQPSFNKRSYFRVEGSWAARDAARAQTRIGTHLRFGVLFMGSTGYAVLSSPFNAKARKDDKERRAFIFLEKCRKWPFSSAMPIKKDPPWGRVLL